MESSGGCGISMSFSVVVAAAGVLWPKKAMVVVVTGGVRQTPVVVTN